MEPNRWTLDDRDKLADNLTEKSEQMEARKEMYLEASRVIRRLDKRIDGREARVRFNESERRVEAVFPTTVEGLEAMCRCRERYRDATIAERSRKDCKAVLHIDV